jgi:hypothetical protein
MGKICYNPPYKKGKIYCIVCFESGRVYVGSTTDYLSARLGDHKTCWRRLREGLRTGWCSSHEILSSGNYGIFLIEDFPCESRKELTTREAYWIDMYGHSAVNRMLRSHQN